MKKIWIVFGIILILIVSVVAIKGDSLFHSEFLVYLHNKYGISYSDMSITNERSSMLLDGFKIPYEKFKTAKIKYDKYDISVYHIYDNNKWKWYDNYQVMVEHEELVSKKTSDIEKIIQEYTNEYILVVEPTVPDYSLYINMSLTVPRLGIQSIFIIK